MSSDLAQISKQNRKRYSDRYAELGYHIRTLGWGTREQQQIRFDQSLNAGLDLNGKSLLDIGCGFGDYFDHLMQRGVEIDEYLGWDLSPDLIEEARDRHKEFDDARFEVHDLFAAEPAPVADVVVLIGVLNLRYDEFDNYDYSRRAIQKAFTLARNGIIVDFLSSHRIDAYPEEDFVFYHDPKVMLEIAFDLTGNVCLKHDYAPIPQKEFMLTLHKS